MLQVGEITTKINIFPFRIRANGARAPQPEAAILKETEAVNSQWVQYVLLCFVENLFKGDSNADNFVRRSLIHRASDVIPRVNAGDGSRGRYVDFFACNRIKDRDPGIVERRVSRIELGPQGANVGNALVVAAIEDCDAIPHASGMRDQQIENRAGIILERTVIAKS